MAQYFPDRLYLVWETFHAPQAFQAQKLVKAAKKAQTGVINPKPQSG